MADPNANPVPGAKSTVQELKDLLRLNGDYNSQLKDNIKDLQRSIDLYSKIDAKLASLEKSSINIKEVGKQITVNTQKQYISNAKLAELETVVEGKQRKAADKYIGALEARAVKQKQLLAAQKVGNASQVQSLEKALNNIEKQVDLKSKYLNIDQLSYVAAKKQKELSDRTQQDLKAQLATEKQINKEIGFTGTIFSNFAKKLGIGEEYYEKMVFRARQLNAEGKKYGMGEKLKLLGQTALGAAKETLKDPAALAAGLGAAFSAVVPILGTIVSGLKAAFDFALGVQDQTVKFGRALGISTKEARDIRGYFADINISNGDLAVNTQKMMEAQVELSKQLGVNNILTAEQLSTAIKLKDYMGLEADAAASITKASIITGKSSQEVTESVLAQVKGLKDATGISLDYKAVLSEVAKLGGALGLQFALYPGKLAKSLVTAKSFGLEIKQLDTMASSFLDFESSISKEFEAQLLTGKDINLTKAREAFLNNDLATAAAEISKNLGSAAEFNKMNRIQQEAFAAAAGMSRDQVGDMLKIQLYQDKLGAKDTASSTEKLKLAKERFKTEQEINKQLGEGTYQSLVTMSAQEKIASFFEKMKVSIGDFLEKSGVVEKLTDLFDWLSKPDNVRKAMMMVRDFAADFVMAIGVLVNGIARIGNIFGAISDENYNKVGSFFEGAENNIRSLGGGMEPAATMNTGTIAGQKTPITQGGAGVAAPTTQAPVFNFMVQTTVGTENWSKQSRTSIQQDAGSIIS